VWLTDSAGRTVFVSPHVQRVGGYTGRGALPPSPVPGAWFGRVHPDDLPMVQKHFVALFGGPAAPSTLEYRLQHKDGRWIWIHDRAVTTYEAQGVTYAYGIYTRHHRPQAGRGDPGAAAEPGHQPCRRRSAGGSRRELHDETAQSLASLLLGLSALRESRTLKGARSAAAELHQVATRALADGAPAGRRPAASAPRRPRPARRGDALRAEFGQMRGLAIRGGTRAASAPAALPPAVETAL